MSQREPTRAAAGFTLIEALVVMTMLAILVLIGLPSLQQLIIRNKLMGVTRMISIQLLAARSEAVKTGVPIVVRPDFDTDSLFVFANVDGDAAFDYTPDPVATARTADYEIATIPLPGAASPDAAIYFWGPADAAAEGPDAVDGFTPAGAGPNVAVFNNNGSVRNVGAFRIADRRGNYFEIRVAPAATARVDVRKYYQTSPPWGGAPDFFPQGRHSSGHPLWRWSY